MIHATRTRSTLHLFLSAALFLSFTPAFAQRTENARWARRIIVLE